MPAPEDKTVRELRHMLLWPLQLRRLGRAGPFKHPWEALRASPGPWREVKDNLLVDDDSMEAFRQIWTSPRRARAKRVAGDESSRSAARPLGDAVHSSD